MKSFDVQMTPVPRRAIAVAINHRDAIRRVDVKRPLATDEHTRLKRRAKISSRDWKSAMQAYLTVAGCEALVLSLAKASAFSRNCFICCFRFARSFFNW